MKLNTKDAAATEGKLDDGSMMQGLFLRILLTGAG